MGKTKLLWELRNWVRHNSYDQSSFQGSFCSCETVLCWPVKPPVEIGQDAVHSYHLDVPTNYNHVTTDDIREQLERMLLDCQAKEIATGKRGTGQRKLILLFDEAQHLLENKAFAFRYIRTWLKLMRNNDVAADVVAVFAGTTSEMMKVYVDPPPISSSRCFYLDTFHQCGTEHYAPFMNLTTIGIFGKQPRGGSDWNKAIPYGRPGFALMKEQELDDKQMMVLRKMLLEPARHWTYSNEGCFSILASHRRSILP